MIDLSQDIHSLSDFKRKTAEHMARMKKSGHPVVLTINGKAELVVQDAASYQKLLDRASRLEHMEDLRLSVEEMRAGKVIPAEQVFAELREMIDEAKAKAQKAR